MSWARRWFRMAWGNWWRNNPMKTKSGLNFLVYKFSTELMRTEGLVLLVKGRLNKVSNFL